MKKLLSLAILVCMFISSTTFAYAAGQPYSLNGYSVSSVAAINFQLNAYTWNTPTVGTPIKAYQNVSGDDSQRWVLNDRYIRSAVNQSLVVTKSGNGTILTMYGHDDYNSKITQYNRGMGHDAYIKYAFEQAHNPVSTMLQLDDYYNGANISFTVANGANNQLWYTGMYY